MAYAYSYGSYRPGLYRSRGGIVFGVCRGLAEYFDLSVFWFRAIVLGAFFLSGFFPTVLIYVVAALLMKREPGYSY